MDIQTENYMSPATLSIKTCKYSAVWYKFISLVIKSYFNFHKIKNFMYTKTWILLKTNGALSVFHFFPSFFSNQFLVYSTSNKPLLKVPSENLLSFCKALVVKLTTDMTKTIRSSYHSPVSV